MHRKLTVLFLALQLSACVYADMQITRASQITVVDDVTGAPIAGAIVQIRSSDDPVRKVSGVTGADGFLSLPALRHRGELIVGTTQDNIFDDVAVKAEGYESYSEESLYGDRNVRNIPDRCVVIRLVRPNRSDPSRLYLTNTKCRPAASLN